MSKSKSPTDFNYESLQDTRSVVKYLEALADGMSSGKMELSTGANKFFIVPNGLINFRLQVEKKRGETKLSLKLSWKDLGDDNRSRPPLKINTKPREDD